MFYCAVASVATIVPRKVKRVPREGRSTKESGEPDPRVQSPPGGPRLIVCMSWNLRDRRTKDVAAPCSVENCCESQEH
jgi:hypothetical protein